MLPGGTRQWYRREVPAHCAGQPESAIGCWVIFCSVRVQRWPVLELQSPVDPGPRSVPHSSNSSWTPPKQTLEVVPREPVSFRLLRLDSAVAAHCPSWLAHSSAASEGRVGSRSRQGLHQFRNVTWLNTAHVSLGRTELLIPFTTCSFINRRFFNGAA